MSRFLNQRTTAGFNSFSARKPAGSPSSRHRLRCISPACSCPCAWRDRRLPTHLRSAHLSPISRGPTKRGTPPHTQPLTPNPAVPPGGPAPSTLRVGAPAGAQGPRKQQRVISKAIRIFAALFSIPFLSIMAFAVTRDNDNCNFCLPPFIFFFNTIMQLELGCSQTGRWAAAGTIAASPHRREVLPRCGSSVGEKTRPGCPPSAAGSGACPGATQHAWAALPALL